MTAFDDALAFTLIQEGVRNWPHDKGYVNDPDDPGGETCAGITHATFADYCRAKGLGDLPLKEITLDQIGDIYRAGYFDAAGCNRFDDIAPKLALCVFDFAVNGGVGRATRYLQAALHSGLVVDGNIGPATLAAVQHAHDTDAIGAAITLYLQLRASHYRARAAMPDAVECLTRLDTHGLHSVAPTPLASQSKWLAGWLARCRHVARACGVPIDPLYAEPSTSAA